MNRLAELNGQAASIVPLPNAVDEGSASSLQAPMSNTASGTLSQIHQISSMAC